METPHGFHLSPQHPSPGVGLSGGSPSPGRGCATIGVVAEDAHLTIQDCIRFSTGNVWVFVTMTDEVWDQLERIVRERGYDRQALDAK